MNLTERKISRKTYMFREKRNKPSKDLANQYNVMTILLDQKVKRKNTKFISDIMLQLTVGEFENWKSQIVISNLK